MFEHQINVLMQGRWQFFIFNFQSTHILSSSRRLIVGGKNLGHTLREYGIILNRQTVKPMKLRNIFVNFFISGQMQFFIGLAVLLAAVTAAQSTSYTILHDHNVFSVYSYCWTEEKILERFKIEIYMHWVHCTHDEMDGGHLLYKLRIDFAY